MAITEKRNTGNKGEEIACTFLMKQGFKIIERNHWRKWGEIDIVAKSNDIYYFIEVKTAIKDISRTPGLDFEYSPADNMTAGKRRRLARVIQTYVTENRLGECDWQVDVILVYLDKNSDKFEVEVIKDIDL